MRINRKDLLDALETVRPGLSVKSQIDAFAHVWFDGKTVMAYNDTDLGVECPFPSELKGGLRGQLVLGLLAASRAKELDISPAGDGELLLKAGGTKLTLPLLPPKQAVWAFPTTEDNKPFPLSKDLLAAVAAVMVSTGDPEPSTPEKLGVTFEPAAKDGYINAYTTDSLTIAAAWFPTPKGYKPDRVTIPTPFWSEVLKRFKAGGKLWVMADSVVAESPDGIRVFARLVNVERPQDFKSALTAALPKGFAKKKYAIPSRMALAFQRAGILLEGHEAESVLVSIKEDMLRMDAKSSFGVLKEAIRLESSTDEVSVALTPALVSRGLGNATSMLVVEDCLALFGSNNFIYLVSACL